MIKRIGVSVLVASFALAGCGSDAGNDEPASAGTDAAVSTAPSTVSGAGDPADDGTDGESSEEASSEEATPAGSTGRLEIAGEAYNLRLGDMPTAMCSVSDSIVTIQDMRAPDGSWVAAFHDAAGGVWQVTFRDADGNRRWVTGNIEEAEGVPFDSLIADNVVSVRGTWVNPDDPTDTSEGRLVVTC